MRKLILLLACIALAFISCRREGRSDIPLADKRLVGTWVIVERYVSIGGPGTWYPAKEANEQIRFSANGEFKGSTNFLPNSTNFNFIDSSRIEVTPFHAGLNQLGVGVEFNTDDELELWPINCVEGCGVRFVRVK